MSSEAGILRKLALMLAGAAIISAAHGNQPPIVNAGENDTVPTGKVVGFTPEVDDDSTQAVDLIIRWRQISGPAQSEIYDTTAPFSSVLFSRTGVYVFLLTATDQQGLSSSDSVTYYVREPIPFQVLAPVNKQPITVGQPFTIRWQNEGNAACRVYVSFDEGVSETMISTQATYDSMVYIFDSGHPVGAEGLILLRYYPGAGPTNVVVSGSFVLVDTLVPVANQRRALSLQQIDARAKTRRMVKGSAILADGERLFDSGGRRRFALPLLPEYCRGRRRR